MTKLSRRPIDRKDLGYYINNLWSVFTLIDNKEQIRDFFRDLFTHTEYKMFAKRLETARRLIEGQTYEQITKDLKIAENTVATISNIIARGGNGYLIAHKKLLDLERFRDKARKKFNDRLIRKFPKFREQVFWEDVIKEGIRRTKGAFRRHIRNVSSQKQFDI